MLITVDDIRKVRPISENINEPDRVHPYIIEVENITIIPAIGYELYSQLILDPIANDLILNGGVYDDGKKRLVGLKSAIALLAYSRFMMNQVINITPYGVKLKNSPDSSEVTESSLINQANQAKNTGMVYLQEVVDYLDAGKCKPAQPVRRSRYRVIGN